jgi:hypothetical protein
MTRKLYQRLHSAFIAICNCERSSNVEWQQKHGVTIQQLVANHMPSGSGWDCGTNYDLSEWSADKMVFHGSYHHMNDGGYYDGWTEHTIIVRPSFDGIELKISGRDRNEIKDYLHEVFHSALCEDIDDVLVAAA